MHKSNSHQELPFTFSAHRNQATEIDIRLASYASPRPLDSWRLCFLSSLKLQEQRLRRNRNLREPNFASARAYLLDISIRPAARPQFRSRVDVDHVLEGSFATQLVRHPPCDNL